MAAKGTNKCGVLEAFDHDSKHFASIIAGLIDQIRPDPQH
jgi:hypothetical protein